MEITDFFVELWKNDQHVITQCNGKRFAWQLDFKIPVQRGNPLRTWCLLRLGRLIYFHVYFLSLTAKLYTFCNASEYTQMDPVRGSTHGPVYSCQVMTL